MRYCTATTIKLVFKAICLIVTAGMIVYWIAKYLKDEDISVVEYKLVENMDTAFQPEFTICFESPFIEEKLNQISSNISSQKYVQYLSGEIPGDEIYRGIDYDNVTIQLFEYLDLFSSIGKFGQGQEFKNCTNINKCPFVTMKNNLNAFMVGSLFYKCFGVRPKPAYLPNITGLALVFNPKLRKILPKLGTVYMGFNYPQQVLQDYMGGRYWDNPNKTGDSEWFKASMVELLRRRNKPSQPCSAEWKELDDWILMQQIKNIGCRAPYIKAYENFPVCDTQVKMQQSIVKWPDATYKYPTPCEGASNIGYKFYNVPFPEHIYNPSSLMISVSYTNKIKIISQSRLIDGQALIGYIGGYVGLLLGKYMFRMQKNNANIFRITIV